MMTRFCILFKLFLLLSILVSCSGSSEQNKEDKTHDPQLRIVSLNGAISELLYEFGLGNKIVGTDITSNYPDMINQLPKVGHNRNISAEGVLQLHPNLIIGDARELKPETVEQLKSTGIKLILINRHFSVAGAKQTASEVAKELEVDTELLERVSENMDSCLAMVEPLGGEFKVLFIYARGAGVMNVSGNNTQMAAMIKLAGAKNAFTDFDEFKPLTPEALVAANPDAILMFTEGLHSINGMDGLMKVPGISETTAGKLGLVASMDGQLLGGFGPRLGEAVLNLNRQFIALQSRKTASVDL